VKEKRATALENPDIEFNANVRAREMCFDEVPETEVRFRGRPERASVSYTERDNLPEEVRRGVTYHDFSVRLRIATRLIEMEPEPREEARSSGTRRHEATEASNEGAEAPEKGGRSD
jgi:hypothetical protein